jgi:hypothetical protein
MDAYFCGIAEIERNLTAKHAYVSFIHDLLVVESSSPSTFPRSFQAENIIEKGESPDKDVKSFILTAVNDTNPGQP